MMGLVNIGSLIAGNYLPLDPFRNRSLPSSQQADLIEEY